MIGQSRASKTLRACLYIALLAIPTASLVWITSILSQIASGVAPISTLASAPKLSVTGSTAGDFALLNGILWASIAINGAQVLVAAIVGMLEIAFERAQATMRFRTFNFFFAFQLCKDAVVVALSLVWQFTLPGGQIDDHLIRRKHRDFVSRPRNPVLTSSEDPTSCPKSTQVETLKVPIFSFASITQPKRYHGSQARQVLVRPQATKSHIPSLPRAPLAQPPAPIPSKVIPSSNANDAHGRADSVEVAMELDPGRLDSSTLFSAGYDDSALGTSFISFHRTGVKLTDTDEALGKEDWNGKA
ncbi:hypothetical protein BCR44DRAFT_1424359 [Catenaria anguillulae PL171]|uniref:Uncharacterized protein n=1 Tax=Catenaria anguillulae PL171 TaxID=765915 RepID=A0A1Y2I2K4_9FUNG|nr:hypothetical protein BCR44DRAFT_1424359 [Catenaria anguillulae PL171]